MATALKVDRARLSLGADDGPEHLRPIWTAVRDHRCTLAILPQGVGPFDVEAERRPVIALAADDTDRALGPAGFDAPSLRRLVERAPAAAVVSCWPIPSAYAQVCGNAVLLRQDVLIVETCSSWRRARSRRSRGSLSCARLIPSSAFSSAPWKGVRRERPADRGSAGRGAGAARNRAARSDEPARGAAAGTPAGTSSSAPVVGDR